MGRNRDLIVCGGSNVSPLEVESVLRQHPAVRDACVVGVTHDLPGQEVQAFVLPAPGAAPSEQELMAFAATRLAQYMVPERIYFVSEMPLKGAGKIDRDNCNGALRRACSACNMAIVQGGAIVGLPSSVELHSCTVGQASGARPDSDTATDNRA